MSEWSDELPTKPGWYWFYGWLHGKWKKDAIGGPKQPGYHMAKVRRISNGVMISIEGHLLGERMPIRGQFIKADFPAPPELHRVFPHLQREEQG